MHFETDRVLACVLQYGRSRDMIDDAKNEQVMSSDKLCFSYGPLQECAPTQAAWIDTQLPPTVTEMRIARTRIDRLARETKALNLRKLIFLGRPPCCTWNIRCALIRTNVLYRLHCWLLIYYL